MVIVVVGAVEAQQVIDLVESTLETGSRNPQIQHRNYHPSIPC